MCLNCEFQLLFLEICLLISRPMLKNCSKLNTCDFYEILKIKQSSKMYRKRNAKTARPKIKLMAIQKLRNTRRSVSGPIGGIALVRLHLPVEIVPEGGQKIRRYAQERRLLHLL